MNKKKAILALLLLVPAPSIGTFCGMVLLPDSALGVTLFSLSKVWILVLPLLWLKFVDRKPFSFSPARKGGFTMGLLSGLAVSGIILAVYFTLGQRLIDRPMLVDRLTEVGFTSLPAYIGAAAYWILVNSVLEEYVWRWFCVEKCEALFRPVPAILCSALFFTIHHIIAMQVFMGWGAVMLSALGIFIGAALWSWMYIRYRSVWPGYLSHAIVDLCVFGLGGITLFSQ